MADKNKIIYLWDDPPFRKMFEPELNPGIDPKKVKAKDCVTKIRYRKEDGQIIEVTPYNLVRRKGFARYREELKCECELCKDVPRFVEWFEVYGSFNPSINLESLKTSDRKTRLYYKAGDKILSITPHKLLARKNIFCHGRSESRYCESDPHFMEWFTQNADLNPEFDPKHISITSSYKIKYRANNNSIKEITVQSLFRKNGKFHLPTQYNNRCWDDPKFRAWFDPELNPNVDPLKLMYTDPKTRLYYRSTDSHKICSIGLRGLKEKKDWNTSPKRTYFAVAVPGFREWFEKYRGLNPDIDLSSLSRFDITPLFYRSSGGDVLSIQTCILCQRLITDSEEETVGPCIDVPGFSEWFEAYRNYNTDIDPTVLMSDMKTVCLTYFYNGHLHKLTPYALCRSKSLLSRPYKTIRGDPLFWCYCVEEDREKVNSYNRNNTSEQFKMRCPKGHEYVQSAERFFYNTDNGREPCPFCDGRAQLVPGVNDAVTIDPEIKLFYSEDNDRPVYMVGAFNGHSDFKFKCPYCGHEFTKRMKNIVGKHPKCPKCKDKGPDVPQDRDYIPEGIPYLVGQDNLRPKKTRKQT